MLQESVRIRSWQRRKAQSRTALTATDAATTYRFSPRTRAADDGRCIISHFSCGGSKWADWSIRGVLRNPIGVIVFSISFNSQNTNGTSCIFLVQQNSISINEDSPRLGSISRCRRKVYGCLLSTSERASERARVSEIEKWMEWLLVGL